MEGGFGNTICLENRGQRQPQAKLGRSSTPKCPISTQYLKEKLMLINLDKTLEYRNLLTMIIGSPKQFPKEFRQQSLDRLMDLDRRYIELLKAQVEAAMTGVALQTIAAREKAGYPCH
jgi:hypothetical protein